MTERFKFVFFVSVRFSMKKLSLQDVASPGGWITVEHVVIVKLLCYSYQKQNSKLLHKAVLAALSRT